MTRTRTVAEQGKTLSFTSRTSRFADWRPGTFSLPGSSSSITDTVHRMPVTRYSDNGGPMNLVRSKNSFTIGTVNDNVYVGPISIRGPKLPGQYAAHNIGTYKSNTEMDSIGTTAIARSEPTNPAFDAATFLGELREGGLRAPGAEALSTLKERTKVAKAAGGEYLNVEFGWKPLVNDLMKLRYAVHNSHQIMTQYRKGSGHQIRRAYNYPSEFDNKQYVGDMLPNPTELNEFFIGSETSQSFSRTWFKGSFRYFLPTNDGQMNKFTDFRQKADKLYGLRLTPEVVWNLSPWSWAADWFGTTGDVIHNISALGHDGLVMQYGYMMAEKKVTITREGRLRTRGVYCSHVSESTLMQRRPATPYGFGVDLHSLSTKQTAILVALGLSR